MANAQPNYKADRERLEHALSERFKKDSRYLSALQHWIELERQDRFKAQAHNID